MRFKGLVWGLLVGASIFSMVNASTDKQRCLSVGGDWFWKNNKWHCSEDVENTFQLVRKKDTLEGYKAYLSRFPYSENADRAKLRIREIEADTARKDYEKALQSNSIEGYSAFIRNHSSAVQLKEALANIYTLTKKENNIAGYEWFIKTYPNAPQVKEAVENIHTLAFAEAKRINTVSAYNTFVFTYPTATQVRDANDRAYEMEKKEYTDIGMMGFFGKEEKLDRKARALLIKAKQIEQQMDCDKTGRMIVANRMYQLLQAEFVDSEATLRHLESQEFKDFVSTFKSVMNDISRKLDRIAENTERMGDYAKEMVSVAQRGFDDAKSDRAMASFYTKQHRDWEQRMHLMDKGYL